MAYWGVGLGAAVLVFWVSCSGAVVGVLLVKCEGVVTLSHAVVTSCIMVSVAEPEHCCTSALERKRDTKASHQGLL